MENINKVFLAMFIQETSLEEYPLEDELLIWDGCSFFLDYVEIDSDTGGYYMANNTTPIAYIELPSVVDAFKALGDDQPHPITTRK
ncbi:conserved hypothetical protein [Vibrio phage 137E35-1]|nr:conserved hypothetical protein [Vibrio phage 137E35-1]CAH9016686.1 conserved hypothetical protein [Vibrio phage 230E39-1]